LKSAAELSVITERLEHWIDAVVIGLDLCPFAHSAKRAGLMRVSVCETGNSAECLQQLADEAASLAAGDSRQTTLLVLSQGFADFEDYLDLLALGNALLEDLGFSGVLQLASFHPHYQFEGTELDDVSNWTNRAPYPLLHILTEDSVEQAIARHPDPESIPMHNIQRLQALGTEGVLRLAMKSA